jgi:hypothetical protein
MKMADSKHRYRAAIIFGGVFIFSVVLLSYSYYLRPGPVEVPCPGNTQCIPTPGVDQVTILAWVPAFTAIISAIGTISALVLAWRSDRRDAREKELKIAQLERELEAAKQPPATPTPKKKLKKAR